MTGRVQSLRSSVAGSRPTGRQPGELYVNWADNQLGVINASSAAQDLIAVRFFSAAASYNVGDFAIQAGQLYRCVTAVGPSSFTPANWAQIGGSVGIGDNSPSNPQPGTLWWDSVGGQLYVWFVDANSSQWVVANNAASVLASGYLPLSGGTLTGPLTLPGNPTTPLQSVPKQYVDSLPVAMNDNRIINGDMRWDQRNNGASGTGGGYTVDRWLYGPSQASKGTWQRILANAGGPIQIAGFNYYLSFISSSAYAVLASDAFYFTQLVEADMVGDLAWGTASAQPVTLSFWALSSLAGTFGGAIRNYPTPSTRSYPFIFTLAADTWTKVVITIPGDTAGTWVLNGNAAAFGLCFDLGAGATYRAPAGAWAAGNFVGANGAVSVVATNGATFYLTGVKLEVGSVATPFNRQSLAKSLADCQRYYSGLLQIYGAGSGQVAGQPFVHGSLSPIWMRAAPTTVNLNTANSSNWTLVSVTSNNSSITANGNATAAGLVILNILFALNAEL